MTFPKAYHYSRLVASAGLLLVLPILAGMCWLLSKLTWESIKSANWIVWLIAIVWIVLLLVNLLLGKMLIRQFFTTSPSLLLTAFGLTDNATKVGEIVWADIKEARLQNAGKGGITVRLTLLNADKYRARLSRFGRIIYMNWFGKDQIVLGLSGTNAKAEEILAIVKAQIAQHT
ncbi:hypothetical protein [Hymenobacter siberiensis]|uniref:hypothetical protein n=1 Tax=Hymenobacter siberiensis TaxID=2848396 RepID=UPI001C1E3CD3|nr:hypothetical protein [Hymenobacter siberiensis]